MDRNDRNGTVTHRKEVQCDNRAVQDRGRPGSPMKTSQRCGELSYAAAPAMIDALWPPKPKLLDITTRSFRSRGVFGV